MYWENTGGSIISGETKKEGVKREIFEEIGLKITDEELETVKRDPYGYAYTTYIIRKNIDIDKDLSFSDNEVIDAKWYKKGEILKLIHNEKIMPFIVPRFEKYVLPLIN